jgi:hypothetical protein
MVPTSLILVPLTAALLISAFAYFAAWPERRLANVYFVAAAGAAGLMIWTLVMSVLEEEVVWLSWTLLALAILWVIASIFLLRSTWL